MSAQFVKHFVQDLQQDIKIRQCGTIVFNADNLSNVIEIELYNGTEAYSGGGTVSCSVIAPDGATVPVTGGTLTGNVVSVTLTGDCFEIPGQIGVGVQLVVNGEDDATTVKTTVLKAIYNVELLDTDTVVDPGSRLETSVSDLENRLTTVIESFPADLTDLLAAIAPTFANNKAYVAGQYVWQDGKLYRFTADHAAGSWTGTPPTDATLVALGNDVSDLKSAMTLDDTNARKVYNVTSVNLFNYNDCELGDYSGSTGAPSTSATVMRTKTPVQITGTHTISNYKSRRFFYDAGMNFISRSDSAYDVDTPENAAFVRFSIAKSVYDAHTDVMVNKGTTLLDYQAFSLEAIITDEAKEYVVRETEGRLEALGTEFHSLSPYETSVNLFDYSDCELGDFDSSGQETESDSVMRTKTPIRIDGDYIVSNYNARKVFYDSSLTPRERSASTSDPVAVPSEAKYVRFSIAKSVYDAHTDIMANIGTVLKQYCDFSLYRVIDSESLANSLYDTLPGAVYKDELYKAFKRVGVCGDSLSVGYSGHTGTYSTIIERNLPYSWPKCIGRDAGAYWLNFGEHGMNVLTWCSSATRGKVQMEAENNKCQMYIICLGVNDSTPTGPRHVDVGQASDIVNDPDTVATTYYGGFARIIQLIKRRNADARIFCSTIPDEQRSSANRTRYKPYNDAVRYIAGTYYTPNDNVFLLDIAADYGEYFNTKGFPLYIEQVGDDRVSHFSSVGYQMISKIYEDAISKVMLKYQPKFMDIMYIPCDSAEPTEDTMVGYEETDNT